MKNECDISVEPSIVPNIKIFFIERSLIGNEELRYFLKNHYDDNQFLSGFSFEKERNLGWLNRRLLSLGPIVTHFLHIT